MTEEIVAGTPPAPISSPGGPSSESGGVSESGGAAPDDGSKYAFESLIAEGAEGRV